MSQKLVIPDEVVISNIYYLRDQKAMLDSDLAELYGVETRVLNQQIKRNIERFPEDFMFQLTTEEWENLKSKNVTPGWGGRRKTPYVFTEHGVLMLSSVLNSKKAIAINIQVIRIFTKLRNHCTGLPLPSLALRPRLQRKARRTKRQLVPADKSDGRSSLSAVAPTAVLAEDLQRKARLGAQKINIEKERIQLLLLYHFLGIPNAINH